jgi:hypothetical protein
LSILKNEYFLKKVKKEKQKRKRTCEAFCLTQREFYPLGIFPQKKGGILPQTKKEGTLPSIIKGIFYPNK